MTKKIHKVSDIESKFTELFNNLKEIYLLAIDLKYLFGEDNSELNELIHESVFMDRIKESFRINFVLKFCAYLDRDDDTNIISFVDRLLVNHKNSEWKKLVKIEELKLFQKELVEIRETTAIKTLIHFRNKIYAHNDKNYAKTDLKTDLSAVLKELEKLRKQFRKIGSKIFKATYIIKSNHFDKDHILLENISRYYDLFDLIDSARNNNEKKIDTYKLVEALSKYQKSDEYYKYF